jgi:predicted metallopeptidase
MNRIQLVTGNPNEVFVSDTTPIIAKIWGTPEIKKNKYIPNPSVILNVEAENLNSSNPNQIQF